MKKSFILLAVLATVSSVPVFSPLAASSQLTAVSAQAVEAQTQVALGAVWMQPKPRKP